MDTTQRTPRFYRIPGYGDVEIPTGPHHYEQKTWVGNVRTGATEAAAFEALRRHATPAQWPVRIGDPPAASDARRPAMDIPIYGPVEHFVFPEHKTIVNTTLEGHRLHPGNVHRRVIREGDDIYVLTQGYGQGKFPRENKILAPYLWKMTDDDIRHRLNRPPPPPASPSTMEGFFPLSNLSRTPFEGLEDVRRKPAPARGGHPRPG